MHVLLLDPHPNGMNRIKALLPPNDVLAFVPTFQAALDHLREHAADVLLCHLDAIPMGETSIQELHTRAPATAVVVIVPGEDEAAGEAAVEMGAQDYVAESEMTGRALGRILRQAIERKQQHESLHQVQERLRIIFESVQDYAIFSTDEDGYINSWNIGAERQFGYTEAEILGQRTDVLFTPEDRAKDAPQGEIRAATETGAAVDERWHLRKDGSRFFASGMMRPLRDPTDRICGFAKVCRDITQRKQMEDELSQMVKLQEAAIVEAEQANRLRDVFVGVISHELRTPLTSIIGFVTTLMADDVQWSPEDVHEFIKIIYAEAERMNSLISQLMDVSQQQSGMLRVHPEQQTLAEVIRRAMPQLRSLCAQHNLVVDVSADLPVLMLDADRIVQVLVNLVGNAVKFSPAGSRVHLLAQARDGVVQIEVSDQGAGIPAEHGEHIFDAFHQAGNGVTSRKGIGLGLTISRGIVEAHGGHIGFRRGENGGTTFYFTLPIPVQP